MGLRPSYGLRDTILDLSTHALQEKLWSVRFRSPNQKWEGKEECEFSGLLGQISNFLTPFSKMCAKICQVATKREIFITIENA